MTAFRAYLGRQAIFDTRLDIHGYELLYRDSEVNRAIFTDGNRASASTIVTAIAELGLDAVIGDRRAFMNLTTDLIEARVRIPLDPARLVIEVLETVPPTPAVFATLRAYREFGFAIALDDFEFGVGRDALLEVADIVKLDVLDLASVRPRLPAQLAVIHAAGAIALAERIERREDFEELRGLGFQLFQGYFLERPVILQGRTMPPSTMAALRLLASLCDPDADLRVAERTLAGDAALTYRLLRMASSASGSRGAPIASVGQAIQRLGTARVAALAVLSLAAGLGEAPGSLLETAAIRGRMGEVLAPSLGARGEHMLLAGLLSVFDVLLQRPLAEIVTELSLPAPVAAALDGTGVEGAILTAIRAYEREDHVALERLGVTPTMATGAFLDAVAWCRSALGALEVKGRPESARPSGSRSPGSAGRTGS